MIKSRKELKFYIKSDCMMNRGFFSNGCCQKVKNIFVPDYIMIYLKLLRKDDYLKNKRGKFAKYKKIFNKSKLRKFGIKLGFSISSNSIGYGLVIPHWGTIVVGEGNKIGNYCVLHTSTCITNGKKDIGDGLYLSTGAKILGDIKLGNNICVAANCVVNRSFEGSNYMLAGVPAVKKKDSKEWYIRDGEEYMRRVQECERLKKTMGIK